MRENNMAVDTQEKVIYTDLKGKHDVSMEINFSDEKDHVKISIDGKDSIIKISDLFNFVFLIADADQQEKLMPIKTETIRKIVKRHVVRVTRDIKKGEMLNVRCETNVPVSIWEGLKGMMGKTQEKKSFQFPIINVKK